jgi:hypothetical protein
VNKVQEKGLANILKAVLSTSKVKDENAPEVQVAYDRVSAFLRRQPGFSKVLGSLHDFSKRYEADPQLKSIVRDIDTVEKEIERATAPRETLKQLIQKMFSRKEVQFSEKNIEIETDSHIKIELSALSSGEKQLLRIFIETLMAGENTILIDEPELSMHIDWQRRLVQSMTQLNPKAQIILATHSPEVMAELKHGGTERRAHLSTMSPPLRHDLLALARAMQVSKTQVFLFTEGHENDPYFYSKICEAVCSPAGISYEHRSVREVPPGAGGKNAVIAFFKYLRRKQLLVNDFKGKRTAVVFFLDKDIDDILGTRLKSLHVVYTKYYDVENHLFAAADLAEVAAAAGSFDKARIAGAIGNSDDWRARNAALWKDWIKLCVFAKKRKIRSEQNYGVTSRINDPPNRPADAAELAARLAQLQAATGLPANKFRRAFARVSKLVENLFAEGSHDIVFKGKWYATLLDAEIRDIAAGRPSSDQNLTGRLLTGLALTVRFDDPWAEYFRTAIGRVLGLL